MSGALLAPASGGSADPCDAGSALMIVYLDLLFAAPNPNTASGTALS